MNFFWKDEFGWNIGTWKTPVSARWISGRLFRHYGIRFDCKFNTLCFGRLEIRVWKPKFLRCGSGIYYFREMKPKEYIAM